MEKLKLLDLFSGIGGFSLGLERSGAFETAAFCEIEEYPRKVLKRHWPGVPIYHDVRELTAERLRSDGITVDAICGGFPCQDLSSAGKQAGIEAERSGLWSECARLLGELQPTVAIFENVTNLLNGCGGDWFKRVLWDISQVGYDAEWHCIPASHLGAPHQRDRVWIIAYPQHPNTDQQRLHRAQMHQWLIQPGNGESCNLGQVRENVPGADHVANPSSRRRSKQGKREIQFQGGTETFSTGKNVPHPDSIEQPGGKYEGITKGGEKAAPEGAESSSCRNSLQAMANPECRGEKMGRHDARTRAVQELDKGSSGAKWAPEPSVGRVANGVPFAMDRLKALGNAVVPQIPEMIGNSIKKALESQG